MLTGNKKTSPTIFPSLCGGQTTLIPSPQYNASQISLPINLKKALAKSSRKIRNKLLL
jgi:hypothetical protein